MWPTLFTIPGLNVPVSGYPVMVLLGFVVALITATRRARKVGADADLMPTAFLILAAGGLIGARAFYVAHYWDKEFAHLQNPWRAALNLGSGGAELYGGILVSIVTMWIYLRWRRKPVALYFDIIVPSIVLAQFFGRLACLLYGCCWGAVCPEVQGQPHPSWAVRFPYGSLPFIEHWKEGRVQVPPELMYQGAEGPQPIPIELLSLNEAQHQLLRQRLLAAAAEPHAANAAAAGAAASGASAAGASAAGASDAGGEGQTVARKELPGHGPHPHQDADAQRGMDELRRALAAIAPPESTPQQAHARLGALRDEAYPLRSAPVHPTQVYFAINALLLALLLGAVFKRRTRDGAVFATMLLLYAPSRIVQESLRADNPRDVFGMTISMAISVALIFGASLYLVYLRRRPPQYGPHGAAQGRAAARPAGAGVSASGAV